MTLSENTAQAASGMRSLRRLLPYAKPYRWQFAAVMLLVIIYNATTVLQPYLVKVAIDSDIAVRHPSGSGLLTISLVYVGVVLAGVVANVLQMWLLQYSGQRIIRRIRIELFTHMERQAMSFFDRNALGRLVTHISSDTETVSQFFTQFFLSLIRDGLSIVMIVIAMVGLDVRLAAWSMLVVPLVFGASVLFRRSLRHAYQTTRTRLSNQMAFLAENLAGMRIIQVFHQERRQADAFRDLNEAHRQANVREYGISVLFNRVLEFLGNGAVAAVVWFGGDSVLHNGLLFGTLYAFISYIRQFFGPINSITQQWNTLQSSMVAAERIGRILDVMPTVTDPTHPVTDETVEQVRGDIVFRDVSFSYRVTEPVLQHISFSIPAGSFVGFVGATGAGKSTVMSLLARFYDPQHGVIELDGTDIRAFRQADLHRLVGLVQQDVHLFSGTVADNIRLFRPDISDAEVEFAARTVGAHEMIERLQDGYQTWMFGKGANLSMGERQLLSFARIVAQNPRVLVLDEATANLDSQTEEWVQAGLQAIAHHRTTLVIAHRLSTIRMADNIFVLDQGRIVEQGTHADLVAAGGLYAALHENSGVEYETGLPAHTTVQQAGDRTPVSPQHM